MERSRGAIEGGTQGLEARTHQPGVILKDLARTAMTEASRHISCVLDPFDFAQGKRFASSG
jgi:hypothetical protein